MPNINKLVWGYIDNRIEIKKALLAGLINVSALARVIAKDNSLEKSIDAIISAIRRYEGKSEKKDWHEQVYGQLKQAKISTKTKLASILVRRNDQTEQKVGSIYSKVSLKRDSTLRIFEVTNYIKIITDLELLSEIKNVFSAADIKKVEKNLGELTINYQADITKVPGLFATISNELAMNDISMVDSMICQWEHMIIVSEPALERAFTVIFNLTRG